MTMSLFGVHIRMVLQLDAQSAPIWFAQLLISIFFISGFIRYYQSLYQYAFNDHSHPTYPVGARTLLMVMSLGTAFILHFMGYMVHSNALMFHNVGLFLLIFPLLDASINKLELLIRLAGAVSVWFMHHNMHFDRPQFVISLILLAFGVILMRKYPRQIRDNIWASLALFAYIAIIFWALLPPYAEHPQDAIWITVQAVTMFLGMAGAASLLWIRQYTEDANNARMKQLANYDQLTNAKTYSLYQHDVTHMFNEARENNQPLTLVSLDIDHFKQINDHYGHLAGNAILISVASKLGDVLSKYGRNHQIYRTGGEEFNVVFYGQTPTDIRPIIVECWDTIRKNKFTYQDFDVTITISLGVTTMRTTDHSIDDTYKRADDNLYLSKHAGRDTITIEGETMHNDAQHELVATYTFFTQAIMHVTDLDHTNRHRSELLLRMYDHEHDRWVLPELFDISVETQIDLMRKALANSPTRRLAINLTNAQFIDQSVALALTQFCNSEDGPDELTVEITDVPDMVTTRNITAIYRAGGIRIDIDDVGSDNSFELVQHLLPYVDGVKFAMQNLRRNNDEAMLQERIRFWADVAQEHGLTFILEGVENAAEVTFAHDTLGIDLFQGYYFDKPQLPSL